MLDHGADPADLTLERQVTWGMSVQSASIMKLGGQKGIRCTMALFWRVFMAVAAVNALSLVVLFGLASVQYDAVLSGLIRDRLAVIAQNTSEPFQAVANLGLPVETLRNADALLERTKQSDGEIRGIYLYDRSGDIVQSTEANPAASIHDAAMAAPNAANSDIWHIEDADAFLVASPVKTSDGIVSGGVLIEYSKVGKSIQVRALAAQLAFIATAILIATLGAGFIVLRFTLSEHVRVFDALLATYDRFERQFWRGLRAGETNPEPVRGFGIDTGEIFSLLEHSEKQYQATGSAGSRKSIGGDT